MNVLLRSLYVVLHPGVHFTLQKRITCGRTLWLWECSSECIDIIWARFRCSADTTGLLWLFYIAYYLQALLIPSQDGNTDSRNVCALQNIYKPMTVNGWQFRSPGEKIELLQQ